jgi:hypothetical protein
MHGATMKIKDCNKTRFTASLHSTGYTLLQIESQQSHIFNKILKKKHLFPKHNNDSNADAMMQNKMY